MTAKEMFEEVEHRLNCIDGQIDDCDAKLQSYGSIPHSIRKKLIKEKENLVKDRNFCNKIKQALQSNVSEEELEFLHLWASRGVSNELKKRTRIARRVTNPETKNLYKMLLNDLRSDYKKILKYISVFDGKRYPNAMVEIKKPQPTLEELKQSIIDRLNEWYGTNETKVIKMGKSFTFDITIEKCLEYDECYHYQFGIDNKGNYIQKGKIPYDLAHDITKFFMEVKR